MEDVSNKFEVSIGKQSMKTDDFATAAKFYLALLDVSKEDISISVISESPGSSTYIRLAKNSSLVEDSDLSIWGMH